MKQPFTILTLVLILAAGVRAAPASEPASAPPPSGRAVAVAYFEALFQGQAEKADALSAVPFFFDRKEFLQTKEQIAAKHQEIARNKGERKLPAYEVMPSPAKAPTLDRKVFPEYEVYRIKLGQGNDHVDIYVTKGASPKVIGFSD